MKKNSRESDEYYHNSWVNIMKHLSKQLDKHNETSILAAG